MKQEVQYKLETASEVDEKTLKELREKMPRTEDVEREACRRLHQTKAFSTVTQSTLHSLFNRGVLVQSIYKRVVLSLVFVTTTKSR